MQGKLVPLPGLEPGTSNTPFERAAFTNLATGAINSIERLGAN